MKNPFFFNLFLIVFSVLGYHSFGQKCHTSIDSTRFQFEISQAHNFEKHSVVKNNRLYHIRVHLFANAMGDLGINSTELATSIFRLNKDFEASGLSFEVSRIDTIEYCQYSELAMPAELAELKVLYYRAGIINLFLVDKINNGGNFEYEGYTEMPGGDDLIIISKEDLIDFGLAHQMGHFFGLYHTFEEMFGLELNDSSNCQVAGDLLCDTPADTIVNITSDCNSSLPIQHDGTGWAPPVSNNMSNWPVCRCRFTIQQYNKIAWESRHTRAYLW